MTMENKVTPAEEEYDEDKLKKMLNTTYLCKDCENNMAICFVCKKKGSYFPAKPSRRTRRKNSSDDVILVEEDEEK